MIFAVMLAFTKDKDIYDMTMRAIKSTLAAEPSCGVDLMLIETNANLKNEPWYSEPYPCRVAYKYPFNYNQALAYARRAFGEGLEHWSAEYFCVLNNDIEAFPGCFDKMLEQLRPNGPFDVVSAKSDRTLVQAEFSGVREGYTAGRLFSGWAWMCCESIFRKAPFEQCFPPDLAFWYQDNYFLDRMIENNFRHALVCDARIDHIESVSHRLLEDREGMTAGQKSVYDSLTEKRRNWNK